MYSEFALSTKRKTAYKCCRVLQVYVLYISQIWVSCDSTHSGHVSRDGFYRSLALVAVAQQGKDEKSLQNYGENGETCLSSS